MTGGTSIIGYGPYNEQNRNYTFFDNVTWIKGRHTFKFGWNTNRYNKTENAASQQGTLRLHQRRRAHRDQLVPAVFRQLPARQRGHFHHAVKPTSLPISGRGSTKPTRRTISRSPRA